MTAVSSNAVMRGDCVSLMREMPSSSVDLILTDPPYLVNYRSRSGFTIRNDDNDRWLAPAFAQAYRVLKPDSFCISFYGWNTVDRFVGAWRAAGFRIAGHLVFPKRYASSVRYLRRQHEQAYLLAKGDPSEPSDPAPDVIDWRYTGNRLHPTEKPVEALKPLIRAFCKPAGLVLDPFCGSGSTLVAAHSLGRRYLGCELDWQHYRTASRRLQRLAESEDCANPVAVAGGQP